ncbi:MAG: phosphatase PAP2 family protein [Chloroflexi bacterium]|nr:phosphatase PAP2 family protein [Chloroflexota bacterium]
MNLESWNQWGLDLIRAVQQVHGPVPDAFFRGVTFLGAEEFYLLLLPALLWCADFKLAARLMVMFLLSSYLNAGLKDLFHQPRPFVIDPGVQLVAESGYGLPSGHAQSSVVVYGSISIWTNRRWSRVAAIVLIALIALIGISRVYLGVHFPTDVLAGWVVGLTVLGLYLIAADRGVERALLALGPARQTFAALVLPLALLAIHPVGNSLSSMAALSGFGVGMVLRRRYLNPAATGSWSQYVLRFLTGGGVLLALYLALRMAFPGQGLPFYPWSHIPGYWLIGLWVSFGAPWLFLQRRK